jgi:hypothetical protein
MINIYIAYSLAIVLCMAKSTHPTLIILYLFNTINEIKKELMKVQLILLFNIFFIYRIILMKLFLLFV